MYCPNCKRQIVDDARFCPYCGSKITAPDLVWSLMPSGGMCAWYFLPRKEMENQEPHVQSQKDAVHAEAGGQRDSAAPKNSAAEKTPSAAKSQTDKAEVKNFFKTAAFTDASDTYAPPFKIAKDGMLKEYSGKAKKVIIPEKINGIPVTRIGSWAFDRCAGLTSISIPEGVTRIDEFAFFGCENLVNIIIPGSVKNIGASAFSGCKKLPIIFIPDGVTSIADYTFKDCTSLTSVSIPASVTKIGNWAFEGCSSLMTVSIPKSVTVIGRNAFFRCTSLDDIHIPRSVKSIGYMAFKDITHITYSGTATYNYFDKNWGAKSVQQDRPARAETNHYGEASADMSQATDASLLPRKEMENQEPHVQSQKDAVHAEAGGQRESAAPKNSAAEKTPSAAKSQTDKAEVKNFFKTAAFTNTSETSASHFRIAKDGTLKRYAAFSVKEEKIIIPKKINGIPVTGIGERAFEDFTNIRGITLPEDITRIDKSAFSGCTALRDITIPVGVTAIAASTFAGCTALTEIFIPDSVTRIDAYAFAGCTGLKEIYIPHSVKYIGYNAFGRVAHITYHGKATYSPYDPRWGAQAIN